ncbi:uncharacterized protein LOC8268166 [Ricinus communis]|uniref:uncharacterized protein LOC8268166 n=1 Tax=Ricinus communis TaxID=3988 RepID=UPI00201B10C6|nr:uncharacterized protein LOC8268166 [Ricinus communis]
MEFTSTNKIKFFIWRATKDYLPTKVQLAKRAQVNDVLCPLCHSVSETTEHILYKCHLSQLVLFGLPLGITSTIWNIQILIAGWQFFLKFFLKKHMLLFLLWYIWYARHKVVWDNNEFDPAAVITSAVNAMQDYKAAWVTQLTDHPAEIVQQVRWKCPPIDWVKLNVDGSTNATTNNACMGAIARDCYG